MNRMYMLSSSPSSNNDYREQNCDRNYSGISATSGYSSSYRNDEREHSYREYGYGISLYSNSITYSHTVNTPQRSTSNLVVSPSIVAYEREQAIKNNKLNSEYKLNQDISIPVTPELCNKPELRKRNVETVIEIDENSEISEDNEKSENNNQKIRTEHISYLKSIQNNIIDKLKHSIGEDRLNSIMWLMNNKLSKMSYLKNNPNIKL